MIQEFWGLLESLLGTGALFTCGQRGVFGDLFGRDGILQSHNSLSGHEFIPRDLQVSLGIEYYLAVQLGSSCLVFLHLRRQL